ncbi:MAG TPA: hypothetical protein VMV27_02125 [Candidatus Binataceae bacterium]|nr:hypothetical protein [Candidatus Binataceae bacterium]
MKALTLTQPWATLVAQGFKCIETRSWATNYRGLLAIHAAKTFPRACRELLAEPAFQVLQDANLPLGAVIGICRLHQCLRMPEGIVNFRAWIERRFGQVTAPELEVQRGDFSPGRFAWDLRFARELDVPIPAKGMLGLWEWRPPAEAPGWLP